MIMFPYTNLQLGNIVWFIWNYIFIDMYFVNVTNDFKEIHQLSYNTKFLFTFVQFKIYITPTVNSNKSY